MYIAGRGRMSLSIVLMVMSGMGLTADSSGPDPHPEYNPRTVLGRPMRAIKDAPFIAGKVVTNQVTDNELVLGVVVEGEARAYPINQLTGPSREIINDTLGNRAIAATW